MKQLYLKMQASLRQANTSNQQQQQLTESSKNAAKQINQGQNENVSIRVETCVVEEIVEAFNDNSRYSNRMKDKKDTQSNDLSMSTGGGKAYDKIPALVLNDIDAVGQDDDDDQNNNNNNNIVDNGNDQQSSQAVYSNGSTDLKRLRNKIEIVATYDDDAPTDEYEALNTSAECEPLNGDDRNELTTQVKLNGKNGSSPKPPEVKQPRQGGNTQSKHSTGNRISLNCFNSPKTGKKSKTNARKCSPVNNNHHAKETTPARHAPSDQGTFQRTAKKEEIEVAVEFDNDFYGSPASKSDPRKSSNGNTITDGGGERLSPLHIVPSITSIASTTTHSVHNNNNLNKFLRNLTRHLRSNNCLW